MAKILLDGSNWASVVNSELTNGAKLEFEDGFKCTVVEYYKAHFFKKGSKTALKIKVGSKTQTIETDALRAAHCPNYVPKKHETKTKAFGYKHLELASQAQLLSLRDAVHEELKRRQDAVNSEIEALEARLKALRGE